MQKISKDEYTPDGKRLCNLSKPLGMIYSDGFSEAKYLQDGQYFRGDRTPIEGMTQRPNDPPKMIEVERTTEEVALAKRVNQLETKVDTMAEGIAAILAAVNKPKGKPGPKKKVSEQPAES